MAVYIPFDIISTNILTRLPTKSLVRFKCVSKSWGSHIESTKFIQYHWKFSLENNTNTSLIVTYGSSLYKVHGFDTSTPSVERLTLHRAFVDNFGSIEVIGSCNGLLCVATGKFLNNYFLYNPSIPDHPKILPFLRNVLSEQYGRSLDHRREDFRVVVGFGYDNFGDDYKIVYLWGEPTHFTDLRGFAYSLKSGYWKRVEPPQHENRWIHCGVLNNCLHFAPEKSNVIVTFDLHNDVWDEVYLPFFYEGSEIIDACIFEGCLCVVAARYDSPELWVMGEYGIEKSWTRVCSLRFRGKSRMLYYCAKRKQLLLSHDSLGLVWYNPERERIVDKLNIDERLRNGSSQIFRESLFPVRSIRKKEDVAKEKLEEEIDPKESEEDGSYKINVEVSESSSSSKKTKKKKKKNKRN